MRQGAKHERAKHERDLSMRGREPSMRERGLNMKRSGKVYSTRENYA